MDKTDKLDQLLFDAAKARTGDMRFDLAWGAVKDAYQKKQKRRANIGRFTSMAAMLVLGLFMGLMAGRSGLIDINALSPQTTPLAASFEIEPTPGPANTPGGIAVDLPSEPNHGGDVKPTPDEDPGDIIVEPPPTDWSQITVPPQIELDPPKIDGGGVEEPYIIEVDPPKTDGFSNISFGNVQLFPDFPKGRPEDFDILGFMPGWLPDGFEEPKVFGSDWSSQRDGGDGWSFIFASFQVARDLPEGLADKLKISEGRPLLMSFGEDESAVNIDWAIRIDEDSYIFIEFINVAFEDTVRVIESIK